MTLGLDIDQSFHDLRERIDPISRTDLKILFAILIVAFGVRLAYALQANNIHHADELFQYLEQAHRLVFGYGIVPWEFRYGFRSWLLPGLIGAILYASDILGFHEPDQYTKIVRGVFCLFSLIPVAAGFGLAYRLQGRFAAHLAALLLAFWYEMVYFAPRPLTECMAAHFLMLALACFCRLQNRLTAFTIGLAAGLVLAVRLQFAPVSLCLVGYYVWREPRIHAGICLGSFAAVILSAGLLDYLSWGTLFASYLTTLRVHLGFGLSEQYASPWNLYPHRLFAASAGMFLMLFAGTLLRATRKSLFLLYAIVIVVVLTHSLQAHKEYRYIFPVIPLLLIIFAIQLSILVQSSPRTGCLVAVYTVLLSILGMFGFLPYERWDNRPVPLFAPNPHLEIYQALSGDDSVRSVCDLTHWIQSGGYYFLHKDIPLVFPGDDVSNPACISASHAIAFDQRFASALRAAGFVPAATFGRLVLWERSHGGIPILPECYGKLAPQPGIDLVLADFPKQIPGITKTELDRFRRCLAEGGFTGFAYSPESR
jgi:hypothetical protein